MTHLPTKKPDGIAFRSICDEIYRNTKPISCHTVNDEGKILGFSYGKISSSTKLRSRYPLITGVVCGSLKNMEETVGKLSMLEATYERFKVLGIPGTELAVLLTVDVERDSLRTKDEVLEFAGPRLKGT